MSNDGTAGIASVPQPAPRSVRVANDPSRGFAAIAALGAAFAGIVSHGRHPDVLSTGLAMGFTFLGALIALHVLHFVYRVTVTLAKIAIPVAAVLLVGCALDWPWAETAADWVRAIGSRGVAVAEHAWVALQAR
ncbi:MAG TPA: hypothetical protein VFZ65_19055 [Planctomycetota bacterium]|nr:hypothetical protein [Planctomycetota bacterium]